MKKRLLSTLLVLAMLATTVVGCGFTGTPEEAPAASTESTEAGDETAAPAAKKSVVLSQLSDPIKYDPRDMVGNDMQMIGIQQYVGLLKSNANGELEPACAESWEISEDFTVYTFKINENVKWSDGKNVTAHDFVYAWTTALNPEYASEAADQYYDIKNAQAYNTGAATVEEVGVKALDDYTLEVTMEYPNGLFTEKVASVKMAPVRQDIVEQFDDPREWAITPDALVVNGPYKMTSYQSKNQIVLTKNENYYDAANVVIDEIVVKFIEEATTALASFRTGEVDICSNIPTAEVPGMIADGSAIASPMLATYYYSLNMDPETQDPAVYEALSKLEVRQALSLAIDRTLITDKVVQGGQKPSKGFVPEGITMPDGSDWTDASDYEFIKPTADVAKAQELLAAAGYPNGEGFPVMEIYYNTSESHQAIAQVVQDMWKQNLGITVELVNKETKVFADERQQGLFQIARSGNLNYSTVYPDILELFQIVNIGTTNESRYNNPEYDALISAATQELDLAKKLEILRQAEDMVIADLPIIPVYSYANVVAVQDHIDNFIQDTSGLIKFEYMTLK